MHASVVPLLQSDRATSRIGAAFLKELTDEDIEITMESRLITYKILCSDLFSRPKEYRQSNGPNKRRKLGSEKVNICPTNLPMTETKVTATTAIQTHPSISRC